MDRSILFIEYFLVLLSVFGISTGQVLLKISAMKIAGGDDWRRMVTTAVNPELVLGIFVLGCSTLLWIYLLRTIPLSIAYPFMALAFLFVPVMSHFVLGEALTGWRMLGAFFIVTGVIVSSR